MPCVDRRQAESPPLRTTTFTTSASASSGPTSSRCRARPSSSFTQAIRRPSIAPPFRRTCQRLADFSSGKKEPDIASFKTPNLRNVLVTGPYFHDGSQETLWDVMDHYNKGDGLQNPYLDEDIQPIT